MWWRIESAKNQQQPFTILLITIVHFADKVTDSKIKVSANGPFWRQYILFALLAKTLKDVSKVFLSTILPFSMFSIK